MITSVHVDLDQPPRLRWADIASMAIEARALCLAFYSELEHAIAPFAADIRDYCRHYMANDHVDELVGISDILQLPLDVVVGANLYYDMMKIVLDDRLPIGCSAFAAPYGDGVLHARNLDWWSPNNLLSSATVLQHFYKGGEELFTAIGWPGYAAVLSGVAQGRFSITLNAALSRFDYRFGKPISFLIREVLEAEPDFESAVQKLSSTPVSGDSLLLVSGTVPNERIVIERVPEGYRHRRATDPLILTNDYQVEPSWQVAGLEGDIGTSTCQRFELLSHLLTGKHQLSPSECYAALDQVRMGLTAQQMVLSASIPLCCIRQGR